MDYPEITNLMYRGEMDTIYQFNIMLVGLTGVGKSTLVKSLFRGKIRPREIDGVQTLNEYEDLIEENGVRVRLRCTETSYFKAHDIDAYTKYIDEHLEAYFKAQVRQGSINIRDTRVHCCIYMIPQHGKLRLDSDDIKCMKALHERVNLVPVISKADSLNSTRRAKFKENVLADLEANGINYFKFVGHPEEDEELALAIKQQAERFPFAVVAADEPIIERNKKIWICESGSCKINIDTDKDYDFDALAKLLIRYCFVDLTDTTHSRHFAKFKHDVLQAAKQQENKNLVAMGFKDWEVFMINHFANGGTMAEIKRRQDRGDEQPLSGLHTELGGTPGRRKPPILAPKPKNWTDSSRNL